MSGPGRSTTWQTPLSATTVLAAILPTYFSEVAASTLSSRTDATQLWSAGLTISLLIAGLLLPVLGTIADVSHAKKRLVAGFTVTGAIATGLLVLVDSGDWKLALVLFVIARIGFMGGDTFYSSLLPHVARDGDEDRVSSNAYALGYLGGGHLLAINIIMVFVLPGTWGPRLSFVTVCVWWLVFSIPLLRRVPEPRSDATPPAGLSETIARTWQHLVTTWSAIRSFGQLGRTVVAGLFYNDGIGTVIALAAIFGAEIGFSTIELVLAILLVQFLGLGYTIAFGKLLADDPRERSRSLGFLTFVTFNGERLTFSHSEGPDHGRWAVLIDNVAALDDDGGPLVLDAYRDTERFDKSFTVDIGRTGVHTDTLVNETSLPGGYGLCSARPSGCGSLGRGGPWRHRSRQYET